MSFRGSPEHIFPKDRQNKGPISNGSDRPAVEQIDLNKLRFKVPESVHTVNGLFSSRGTLIEGGWGQTIRAQQFTPVTVRPVQSAFTVRYGGGRAYGGGTSVEAIRRARRKQRSR